MERKVIRKVEAKTKSGHFVQYYEKNEEMAAKCTFGDKQTKTCKLKMFGSELYIHLSYTNKDLQFKNASLKYTEFQELCSHMSEINRCANEIWCSHISKHPKNTQDRVRL